ncbi:hypothetical protein [Roseomonas sp. WA12]
MSKGMQTRKAPVGAVVSAAIASGRAGRPTERLSEQEIAEIRASRGRAAEPVSAETLAVAEEIEDRDARARITHPAFDMRAKSGAPISPPPRRSVPAPAALPNVHSPADATFVAQACTDGGHPELISRLLSLGATQAGVAKDLDRAQMIAGIGRNLGLPTAAAKAIVGGMEVDSFREIAFGAKADADAAIVTDTSHHSGMPVPTAKAPDPDKVYARLNTSESVARG